MRAATWGKASKLAEPSLRSSVICFQPHVFLLLSLVLVFFLSFLLHPISLFSLLMCFLLGWWVVGVFRSAAMMKLSLSFPPLTAGHVGPAPNVCCSCETNKFLRYCPPCPRLSGFILSLFFLLLFAPCRACCGGGMHTPACSYCSAVITMMSRSCFSNFSSVLFEKYHGTPLTREIVKLRNEGGTRETPRSCKVSNRRIAALPIEEA